MFDQILVSIVYQETGKWDRYLVFVKGGGCREIKNGKQRFEVENEKKEKKDEKKKERKDEKKEKRESGEEEKEPKRLMWVNGIGLVHGEAGKEKSGIERE